MPDSAVAPASGMATTFSASIRSRVLCIGANRLDHRTRYFRRRLMLPKTQHAPASLGQPEGRIGVARNVVRHLGGPVGAVCYRGLVMLGTTMPKTAVYEDRDLVSCKCDIGGTTREHGVIHPVAKASRVHQPPDGQLGLCISPLVRLHRSSCRVGRRPRLTRYTHEKPSDPASRSVPRQSSPRSPFPVGSELRCRSGERSRSSTPRTYACEGTPGAPLPRNE